jgi:hypothetical protein
MRQNRSLSKELQDLSIPTLKNPARAQESKLFLE